MGVYIKDISKPSDCKDCFLFDSLCKQQENYHCEFREDKDHFWMPYWVADNCPMIEIKSLHNKIVEFIDDVDINGEINNED